MLRHRITLVILATLALAGESAAAEPDQVRAAVEQYCVACHAGATPQGELNLAAVVDDDFARHPELWEKVVRRLRGRQMPPEGKKRPDEATYAAVVSQLET